MKKTSKFLMLVSIVVILTFVQVIIIKGMSNEKETKKVAVASDNIEAYKEIGQGKYEFIDVDVNLVPDDAITDISQLEQMVAAADIYKNKIIVKSDLVDNKTIYECKKGNRLIAIEPKADEVNAWQINKNDIVDVVCVKNNKEQIVVEDVEIAALINETFDGVTESDTPKLVILEATMEKAIKIASCKNVGNITILTHRMGGQLE